MNSPIEAAIGDPHSQSEHLSPFPRTLSSLNNREIPVSSPPLHISTPPKQSSSGNLNQHRPTSPNSYGSNLGGVGLEDRNRMSRRGVNDQLHSSTQGEGGTAGTSSSFLHVDNPLQQQKARKRTEENEGNVDDDDDDDTYEKPLFHFDDLVVMIWNVRNQNVLHNAADEAWDNTPEVLSRHAFATFSRSRCVLFCLERRVPIEHVVGKDILEIRCDEGKKEVLFFSFAAALEEQGMTRGPRTPDRKPPCWASIQVTCPNPSITREFALSLRALRARYFGTPNKDATQSAMEEALVLQQEARTWLTNLGIRPADLPPDPKESEVEDFEWWKLRKLVSYHQKSRKKGLEAEDVRRDLIKKLFKGNSGSRDGDDDDRSTKSSSRDSSVSSITEVSETSSQSSSSSASTRHKRKKHSKHGKAKKHGHRSRSGHKRKSKSRSHSNRGDSFPPQMPFVSPYPQQPAAWMSPYGPISPVWDTVPPPMPYEASPLPVASPRTHSNNNGQSSSPGIRCMWCQLRCPVGHQERCGMRLVACPYCNKEGRTGSDPVVFRAAEYRKHMETCPARQASKERDRAVENESRSRSRSGKRLWTDARLAVMRNRGQVEDDGDNSASRRASQKRMEKANSVIATSQRQRQSAEQPLSKRVSAVRDSPSSMRGSSLQHRAGSSRHTGGSQEDSGQQHFCVWCGRPSPPSHDGKCAKRVVRCNRCKEKMTLKEYAEHNSGCKEMK